MNENKTTQAFETEKPNRQSFLKKIFNKAQLRSTMMVMTLCSLLCVGAFADDGTGAASGGFDAVIGSLDTISTLLGKVFTLMTSNTLLALFLGFSLLGAAVGVFIMLKHAARR